jgi:hypothetical protein
LHVPFIYPAEHPALSDTLTHLCGRARQSEVPPDIAKMTADERLRSVLWSQTITGFPPYGGSDPVVCFTESRPEGLAYLIRQKDWEPWGVVLRRGSVYELGGGPVWYIRGDLWPRATATDAAWMKPWTVRFQPGEAEWLHEREWRIPTANLSLTPAHIRAVIIGDPSWHPGMRTVEGISEFTGDLGLREEPPPLVNGVEVWCWNPMMGGFDVRPPWCGYPHPT